MRPHHRPSLQITTASGTGNEPMRPPLSLRDRGRSRRRAETPVAVDHRLSVVGRTGDAGPIAAVLPAPPCHDRRRPTRADPAGRSETSGNRKEKVPSAIVPCAM
jgi:hypothetical protein